MSKRADLIASEVQTSVPPGIDTVTATAAERLKCPHCGEDVIVAVTGVVGLTTDEAVSDLPEEAP